MIRQIILAASLAAISVNAGASNINDVLSDLAVAKLETMDMVTSTCFVNYDSLPECFVTLHGGVIVKYIPRFTYEEFTLGEPQAPEKTEEWFYIKYKAARIIDNGFGVDLYPRSVHGAPNLLEMVK